MPMCWGLVPSWHKGDPKTVGLSLNNCRSESMLQKPSFRNPLQKGRRCVVLADGFYEWKRDTTPKQPYFVYFKVNSPESFCATEKSTTDDISRIEMKLAEVEDEKEEPLQSGKNEGQPAELVNIKVEPSLSEKLKEETSRLENVEQNPPHSENIEEERTQLKNVKQESPQSNKVKKEATESVNIKQEPPQSEKSEGEQTDKQMYERVKSDPEKCCGERRRLLTMAGVFDVWHPPNGGDPLYTYSVITVDSPPRFRNIHHRIPAILSSEEEVEAWLDFSSVPASKAAGLCRSTDEMLAWHRVTTVVNNSRNNSSECVQPLGMAEEKAKRVPGRLESWLAKAKPQGQAREGQTSPSRGVKKQQSSTTPLMSWLQKGKRKCEADTDVATVSAAEKKPKLE
ncbi:PREDICTED: embryonic stem cell-specific 5-hydroxymethylcytosine-binding protein-like isoform X2 [Priapulus caudatus]|nr:PREDICTED: embryonic stem cell-specific 5-hydroxymethylcytosine-binding protein-like isoform X2 [Priapulus caudatus]